MDDEYEHARRTLNTWGGENKGAPLYWRQLADLLANHHDMPEAWAELGKRGDVVMPFFSCVCKAFKAAAKEAVRQTATEERAQLERVRRLTGELKMAIEQSPLPRGWAKLMELTAHDEKPAMLWLGWRDLQESGLGFGYQLAIVEVLDRAAELLDSHIAALPPRAVKRHRDKPHIVAFIRWLTFYVSHEFGEELHGTVARVATAVFDQAEPLTKRDVESILKDRPPEFAPLKNRPKEP